MRLRLLSLVTIAFALAACAGSRPSEPTTPVKATRPAAPAVPEDPLALVPPDAQAFASLDIAAFASASDFATWRGWAQTFACVEPADIDWLITGSRRMVLAVRGTQPKTELIAIFAGHYTDNDVMRALSLAQRGGQPVMLPASVAPHGRFSVTTQGAVSGVQLEGRLLVVGDTAIVNAALALIDAAPPQRFADGEPFRHLAKRLSCNDHAACAATARNSAASRVLKRQLGAVGMKELGQNLAGSASGVSLDIRSGLGVATVSELPDEATARTVEKQINDWLWQLGVFARFAGFPEVLDEIKVVRGADNAIELRVQVDAATLANLERRLKDVFEDRGARCGAEPTAEASAAGAPSGSSQAAPAATEAAP